MWNNAFCSKDDKPTPSTLKVALGPSSACWDEIIAHVVKCRPGLLQEWKFYGQKHGWQLKLSDKKRAVVYLIPRKDSFLAGTALPDNALAKLRQSDLPEALIQEIEQSKAFPEGKPARYVVKTAADVKVVETLLSLKLEQ